MIGLLGAAVMWTLAKYLPLWQISLPRQSTIALLIAIAGVGIDLTALWSFRKARTTINPMTPEKSSAVVSEGLYRYSRNPMYVGQLILLVAFAVYLGALSAWVVPPIFVWVITVCQIIPEERVLEQLFGQPYIDYKKSVRRWL